FFMSVRDKNSYSGTQTNTVHICRKYHGSEIADKEHPIAKCLKEWIGCPDHTRPEESPKVPAMQGFLIFRRIEITEHATDEDKQNLSKFFGIPLSHLPPTTYAQSIQNTLQTIPK